MNENLNLLKEKFVELIEKAEQGSVPAFVQWLDQKLAEYKVCGYLSVDKTVEESKDWGEYIHSAVAFDSGDQTTLLIHTESEKQEEENSPPSKEKMAEEGGAAPKQNFISELLTSLSRDQSTSGELQVSGQKYVITKPDSDLFKNKNIRVIVTKSKDKFVDLLAKHNLPSNLADQQEAAAKSAKKRKAAETIVIQPKKVKDEEEEEEFEGEEEEEEEEEEEVVPTTRTRGSPKQAAKPPLATGVKSSPAQRAAAARQARQQLEEQEELDEPPPRNTQVRAKTSPGKAKQASPVKVPGPRLNPNQKEPHRPHPHNMLPHTCPHCQKVFYGLGVFAMHAATHKNEFKYECSRCCLAFYDRENFDKHRCNKNYTIFKQSKD